MSEPSSTFAGAANEAVGATLSTSTVELYEETPLSLSTMAAVTTGALGPSSNRQLVDGVLDADA